MLSGVGPKEQLEHHNIQVVHYLPGVGENFQDHCMTPLTVRLRDGANDRPLLLSNPTAVAAAREQFITDGSGPLTSLYNHVTMGFVKNPSLASTAEFHSLPAETREHSQRLTIPAWEFVSHTPTFSAAEDVTKPYLTVIAIGMIPQSKGTVTLRSANPVAAPVANPAFLEHPFDRRNMIEAVRHLMGILEQTSLAGDIVAPLHMPRSASDDDISEYLKEFASTAWHMSGSIKMGKDEDEMACVDSCFRVRGVKGLRVADVSVTPFLPNCHTVSVAYLVGNLAAEKIIGEYGLNS